MTQDEDGEMAIRKKQHSRDQKWKETGRNQIKKNTNFDMARSLFGGEGPADYEEDDGDVADQVENLALSDGEDDVYEEEEVTSDDDGVEVVEEIVQEGEESEEDVELSEDDEDE